MTGIRSKFATGNRIDFSDRNVSDIIHNRRKRAPVKIAILDLETDPFDNQDSGGVYPFLAVLYLGPDQPPIVQWDENWKRLMAWVSRTIEDLPNRYIIYAHNGGRFDYLFLLSELRGEVMFKGRALMTAHIGKHELRDSLHIIPESLKNANRKMVIDYTLFRRGKRDAHRTAITEYCIDDCVSLYEVVASFKDEFGTPLTIGQAAMARLKSHYKFDRLSEGSDAYFREWFFGGRVECLRYGIYERTKYNLYDVNSMYPYVMAKYSHPISSSYTLGTRVTDNTIFLRLHCTNQNALVSRTETGGLTTRCREGTFNTTIWEYNIAMAYGLIRDVELINTIEFDRTTTFEHFINPLYEGRLQAKAALDQATKAGDIIKAQNLSRDVLFKKLLMNNAYGKFAQNPRRFKVHHLTAPCERPDEWRQGDGDSIWGELPSVETDNYWLWSHPTTDLRFNNVATAASITGAARAVLLEALVTSHNPVYCDTDSIICEALNDNQHIDRYALGAWDIEKQIDAYIGNGKKLYAYHSPGGNSSSKCPVCGDNHNGVTVRAKGMNGVTWQDMLHIANGNTVTKRMNAPLIGRDGSQVYIDRVLRQTRESDTIAA